MTSKVRIAMVQDNFSVGDIKGNADRIIRLAIAARDAGADLALFPELALAGYPPEDLLYRTDFIAQIATELQRIKTRVTAIDVVLGLPVSADGNLYNAAIWLRNGECIATYYKQHLPNYSVFDEMRYFSAGTDAVVVELNGIHFGLAICEDVWESDQVMQTRNAGAEVMLVINASPYHMGKYDDRVAVLKQRVMECQLPFLYLNMVGGQDELVFDGDSLVIDKSGNVMERMPAFEAALDMIDIGDDGPMPQSSGIAKVLQQEEMIYRALVMGVHDYVTKNGFSGVVLGLSGGVDSALTLAIAVDALGAENVQAVMMPSPYTADMSLQDAEAEAVNLGVRYDVMSIESVYQSFTTLLEDMFAGLSPDITEENIQARCRGVILMAISNKTGKMLLTTGNKSEVAVGYVTLYGDMSGGFAPLKDVYKTMVYKLCRYRNGISNVIPERVLTRAPTAELREDQCDQDSLPAYDVLDRILELSVEQDKSISDIVAAGFEREVVERVAGMVQRNEYKRRQAAPGVRITKRAFGRDRRYPITSAYRGN